MKLDIVCFNYLKLDYMKSDRGKKGEKFFILWYLNYEIRNGMMWRNNLNLYWNFEGYVIVFWSYNDLGNFNDLKRIFLILFV